jgi:hypothetical protein
MRNWILPRSVLLLAAVYFVASLAHFSHNAEYIAFGLGLVLLLVSSVLLARRALPAG